LNHKLALLQQIEKVERRKRAGGEGTREGGEEGTALKGYKVKKVKNLSKEKGNEKKLKKTNKKTKKGNFTLQSISFLSCGVHPFVKIMKIMWGCCLLLSGWQEVLGAEGWRKEAFLS